MVKFMKKNAKGKKTVQNKKANNQRKTPFADAGEAIGYGASQFFGMPGLKGVGKLLGSGIGRIFGSGDYKVVGPEPRMNVLKGSTPQFSSTRATNIVCHREYVADINGTTAFTNTSYAIQPANSTTFPWLAQVAASYSQYRIHGMIFEFKPLITDFITGGAPGVIILSTNYNADDPLFTTKRQMENSEFAVSIKPTDQIIHMIECDPKQTSINELYTRSGAIPAGQDYKAYDLGNFQIATQGNPVQLLGELWVSYCIEFFKPELPVAGFVVDSHTTRYTAASTTIDLGLTAIAQAGGITPSAITQNSVTYSNLIPNTNYLWEWATTFSGVLGSLATVAVTTGTAVPGFISGAAANTAPYSYIGSNSGSVYSAVIKSSAAGVIKMTVPGTSSVASTTLGVDIYLSLIEQTLN